MLVSHDYKFIFIKTKKTAGSSLETYLKPFCENGIVGKKLEEKHTTAAEIKSIVGDQIWDDYTKIVPIRNPWDTMVSMYFWRGRKRPFYYWIYRWFIKFKLNGPMEQSMSFQEWITEKRDQLNENREIIYVDGQIDGYKFIHYENLVGDLESICKELGIPFEIARLPHEKGGHRPKRDYKTFYNDEAREIVAKEFEREIKEFGYTF